MKNRRINKQTPIKEAIFIKKAPQGGKDIGKLIKNSKHDTALIVGA